MTTQPLGLPADRRAQQGGLLFLGSLLVFFLASIVLYLLYAYWRRDDLTNPPRLPFSFVLSTGCLLLISPLMHLATNAAAREYRRRMVGYLLVSLLIAIGFMGVQVGALDEIMRIPALTITPEKGVMGMVIVLAVLHGLHVAGGVIALGLVTYGALRGRYDHERYWAVRFSATYWHFLDIVWICMLTAFWMTSGGFQLPSNLHWSMPF